MQHSIEYAKVLNPLQWDVVKGGDGYSLVLAGAGSGKTRVLVYRLAYLLEQGVPPQQILLLTFTNKASREMLSRAASLVGREYHTLWGGTFHHMANKILRREASRLGFTSDFTILDRGDAEDLVTECAKQLFPVKDPSLPKPDVIEQIIGFAVNAQMPVPEIVARRYDYLAEYSAQIAEIASRYRQRKQKGNLMDFDDLLYYWNIVLDDAAVREKYARQFQYILVDEHQDTNKIQFEILRKLSSVHHNLLAVGDDAQSIYSFRAADIRNVLDFPKLFKEVKIFPLTINYRSTPQILAFANQSIMHNKGQFPKTLSAVNPAGGVPQVVKAQDVYQQAEYCVQTIEHLTASGLALHRIAVLFRSRYQAVETEMAVVRANIPYVIRGGVRFFEQAHIKDVVAYLKMRGNPRDEIAFKRVMKLQPGISTGYAEKIWQRVSAGDTFASIVATLPARAREGFNQFLRVYQSIESMDNPAQIVSEVVERFYREYGKRAFDDYQERMLELEELTKVAEQFGTLKTFLSDLSTYENFKGEKAAAAASGQDVLVLSTIHQAKGLEWDAVLIIGCAQGMFPGAKSIDEGAIEEERRLFYVAVTRAKQRLFVVYPVMRYTSSGGFLYSRPSVFLEELPPQVYTAVDCSGDLSPSLY